MSNQQPYILLKEDTQQLKGKDALIINIGAIKAIAETIRTTLGPKGLNKMLVDDLGDITVTGDGAKILEELSIENPSAKMIVELSKTIHKKSGDGASSVVLFIGELMERTAEMISMDISPTLIYEGYLKAVKQIKMDLFDLALPILETEQDNIFTALVKTALNSKSLFDAKDLFTSIIVQAISKIQEFRAKSPYIDLDNIQIIKREGNSLNSTQIIDGIIIDKEIVNPSMPRRLQDAKIALINGAMEIVKTDFSSEIQITNPEDIQNYLHQEEMIIQSLVEAIKVSGANVVFCQKGIDESAQHYLAKYNIIAIRRVKNSDMQKLAKSSGARIVTHIKDITADDLGYATTVSEKKIGSDNMVFIEGCHNPKSVTILIRGSTETIVNDAERSLKNGLNVLKATVEDARYVGGGGSIEIELRKRLRAYAEKIGGKQQIAIEQYADAIEIIPKLLVENSGKDPLDIITSLRSQSNYSQNKWFGFDCYSKTIVDVRNHEILDPVGIKWQIFNLATELSVIFIRIDDYIRAKGQ
ncbi:MAG: thermosome subunit beta [Promethearchaeota archaeon]